MTGHKTISSQGLAFIHRGDEPSGAKPPVVLLHGVGLCAGAWQAQIDTLSAKFRVYAPDLPGHGGSACLDTDQARLSDYTAAIRTFIYEHIQEPVIIIGHSLGALIALDFAINYSHLCCGCAALSTIYGRSDEARTAVIVRAQELSQTSQSNDIAAAPVARWFGETPTGDVKHMADQCRNWLQNTNRKGYATAYKVFAEHRDPADKTFTTLNCPTLFMTGEDDPNSTPLMSSSLATLTPNGQTVIIPEARHMLQMTHAESVTEALVNFIRACELAMSERT